jgi:hypothetical protein
MKQNLNILIEEKEEIELFISLLCLGITNALEKKYINIELAEKIIFAPYVMKQLKSISLSNDLIDVIHQGTEIGDIEKHAFSHLDSAYEILYNSIYKIIKDSSKEKQNLTQRWIK